MLFETAKVNSCAIHLNKFSRLHSIFFSGASFFIYNTLAKRCKAPFGDSHSPDTTETISRYVVTSKEEVPV